MNRTVEEAKKCICPILYEAVVKSTLAPFNIYCSTDHCMAWEKHGLICDTCGNKLDFNGDCTCYIGLSTSEKIMIWHEKCTGKSVVVGYCKLIHKE